MLIRKTGSLVSISDLLQFFRLGFLLGRAESLWLDLLGLHFPVMGLGDLLLLGFWGVAKVIQVVVLLVVYGVGFVQVLFLLMRDEGLQVGSFELSADQVGVLLQKVLLF